MAWPCRQVIHSVFEHLARGDQDSFFKHVADDVEWTVQSKTTMGGTYHSKKDFQDATFNVLGTILDPEAPLRPQVINIIGGGDQSWAAIELKADSKTKEGTDYQQTYVWVTRWKMLRNAPEGQIVEVRAYVDTALLDKIVGEKKDQGNY